MKSKQQAMDNLGDFMKLLAKGCHVRVGGMVYRLMEDNEEGWMARQDSEEYPTGKWHLSSRSLGDWFVQLHFHGIEVLYAPTNQAPTRQVRSIEL